MNELIPEHGCFGSHKIGTLSVNKLPENKRKATHANY